MCGNEILLNTKVRVTPSDNKCRVFISRLYVKRSPIKFQGDKVERHMTIDCAWLTISQIHWALVERERETSVSGGDRRELSVCLIHPQSDAHMTKVWKYRSTPPFREYEP